MAHAIAYGSATHYKASATQGKTRTFVGVYEFDLLYALPQVSVHMRMCVSISIWGW